MVDTLQHAINGKVGSSSRRTGRPDVYRNTIQKQQAKNSEQELTYLDLFSTSQTNANSVKHKKGSTDRKIYDICANNAPYFAYEIAGKVWGVIQGCCNDWTCPRCGQQRAREEYGRIVAGAREIAKSSDLYLLTITCRGKEMDYETAQHGYLEWTNRLLTRLRSSAKRDSKPWAYASVTERQERNHPHSHFITTYCPADCIYIPKGGRKYFYSQMVWFPAKHNTLQSQYLERACVECGLGWQYDISRLESVEAGSRYAAKYLFKADVFHTVWPKGWRRVRYSQNWPKLPEVQSTAIILLSNDDWDNLARKALVVKTKDDGAHVFAEGKLRHADVIVQ